MRSGKTPLHSVWKAFDEAQFGLKNTLNLRESLPTAADARFRTEAWLRERQVSRAGEVLVITGRGNQSPNGISPVREAIVSLLPLLRRRGVVSEWRSTRPDRSSSSLDRSHRSSTRRAASGTKRRTGLWQPKISRRPRELDPRSVAPAGYPLSRVSRRSRACGVHRSGNVVKVQFAGRGCHSRTGR